MGAFVDSLFGVLMSWVRALVSGIWALMDTERTTLLEFLGKNWIVIAVVLIAAGLVIDWLIWLIRWQPYHIWAVRARRLLHIGLPEDDGMELPDEDETDLPEEDGAFMPPLRKAAPAEPQEQWLPLEAPVVDEEAAQQVLAAADETPDERVYPGMRYDEARAAEMLAGETPSDMEGTRRYAAVHAEGPGAAEVTRRRAEIDAWQLQMQEEARQKAEAERAARLAEAERERRAAIEAYEAEQARLTKEAQEAEQARLAREEYERQLAEYERQKAQYERDLAEYERQKAQYEAEMARQAAREAEEARLAQEEAARLAGEEAARQAAQAHRMQEAAQHETAGALAPAHSARRRRRTAYSDYVEGEDVTELPAAPQWEPMEKMQPQDTGTDVPKPDEEKADRKSIWRSGMKLMAQMMEAEETDVTGIASLPPRVDKNKAYKPAKKPKL